MDELNTLFLRTVNAVLLTIVSAISVPVWAESIEPKDGVTVDDDVLLEALLGSKVTASTIEVSGHNAQFGLFSGYEFLFGSDFDSGVIMSTGDVSSVISSENTSDKSSHAFTASPVDDVDLGLELFDPAKLSFKFVPQFNAIVLDFIFGSEEYNEYVHGDFNDNFVVLVNGVNCAKTPDGEAFSINTVNDRAQYPPLYGEVGPSSNPDLYINNDPGLDDEHSKIYLEEESSSAGYATEMDGFTKKIRCLASVTPNAENTIVIGIVDKGDPSMDSWVFFKTNGLYSSVHDNNYDADKDGISDYVEGTIDTDNDGIEDYLDTDSDNDGIPDSIEDQNTPPLTGLDHDGDWLDDAIDVDLTGGSDNNGNGIDDAFEPTDTDGDGIPDYRDLDSDDDSIPDAVEAADVPALTGNDTDSDGLDDALDVDQTGGQDANNDGVDDALAPVDTDNDGIPDAYDLDSDDDGISDLAEAGSSLMDINGNGIDDYFDVLITGGNDADADGIDDDRYPDDFDNDGVPNVHDLDSDNDSLSDVSESGLAGADANNDGLVDNGELTDDPRNSDGAGNPDFIELDSDGDGINDIDGSPASDLDSDGDGQIDDNSDNDGDGLPDAIDLDDSLHGIDTDLDSDLVYSSSDLDNDNDGIPDTIERPDGVDRDSDGDGQPDHLDLDSDNDGIPDSIEFQGDTNIDKDLDGLVDNDTDSNGDGLADVISDTATAIDTDGDGTPDYLDTDSDGDGLSDLKESLSPGMGIDIIDADGNGVLDSSTDADGNGLIDVVDPDQGGTVLTLSDIDGDGLPAYRDVDTDGDGFNDDIEDGDFNNDGTNDRLQVMESLKTAVSGFGLGSLGLEYLLMLPLLVWMRRKYNASA